MREQVMFPCTIMRGGTSKAVFIKANILPAESQLRDRVILAIFGSPDVRQIDGLGGSDVTTSKVAIIAPSDREDADVDYTFGQVSLVSPVVDYSSNCGNISAAVGPYAIDEGMVKTREPVTVVRIHNTNTGKLLLAKVPVKCGFAAVEGEYYIDSVSGSGARVELDYRETSGASTGKLLPTGRVVDMLEVEGVGRLVASLVDMANPVVFVHARLLGLKGTESRPELNASREIMDTIERVRGAAAVKFGFVDRAEMAVKQSPLRPMLAVVCEASDYVDYASGKIIRAAEMDFAARIIFNQMTVETYTGTGTICTAVAAAIEGTVVNRVSSASQNLGGLVRFGHPRGINEVDVEVQKEGGDFQVKRAVFGRTARRILDGYVYVKKSQLNCPAKY